MQYLAGLGVYIGHPPGPGRSNHSEIRFVIGLETGLDSNFSASYPVRCLALRVMCAPRFDSQGRTLCHMRRLFELFEDARVPC